LLARYYLHWSDNLVFVMREAATVELRLLIDHSVIEAFAQGVLHPCDSNPLLANQNPLLANLPLHTFATYQLICPTL
jgi:hypothetical protein